MAEFPAAGLALPERAAAGLAVYGGDPRVVAARDELARIASALRQCASAMGQAAATGWQRLGSDWLALPEALAGEWRLAARLPELQQRLNRLADAAELAAEAYFSLEAQLSRAIYARCVLPLGELNKLNALPGVRVTLGGSAVAFGLAALGTMPQSNLLVRTATAAVPAVAGADTVPGLLNQLRLNLGLLGIPGESAAAATLVATGTVAAAQSLAQHTQRLQQSYRPGGSIRIESYQHAAGRQFVVYIPGTQSAKLSGTMPLDMRSNLKAMAAPGLAASERAVLAALGQLGAGKNDSVLLVGHSQGALIANNIAASRQPFRVSGFISVGGPIAHRPPGVPTVALEHLNDPVPALAGRVNPLTENLVTVQRQVDTRDIITAHAMPGYLETARLADASENAGLARIRQEISGQLANLGEGQLHEFRLLRTANGDPAARATG